MAQAPRTVHNGKRGIRRGLVMSAGLLYAWSLLLPPGAFAARTIEKENDPKGFRGIPWGAPLQTIDGLKRISSFRFIEEYEYEDGTPRWADAAVESLTLSAAYGKFARVSIKYHGEQTHKQVMAHLESRFGKVQLMPGAMMRGLNQQYTWRGTTTEINLTYQSFGERGFIFIESRMFAPAFNDVIPEHGY